MVDGIFSRDDGDLKSITPPSFLIMSARQESAEEKSFIQCHTSFFSSSGPGQVRKTRSSAENSKSRIWT